MTNLHPGPNSFSCVFKESSFSYQPTDWLTGRRRARELVAPFRKKAGKEEGEKCWKERKFERNYFCPKQESWKSTLTQHGTSSRAITREIGAPCGSRNDETGGTFCFSKTPLLQKKDWGLRQSPRIQSFFSRSNSLKILNPNHRKCWLSHENIRLRNVAPGISHLPPSPQGGPCSWVKRVSLRFFLRVCLL